jgi:glyceraldehyde-3-phosphate dehydrogenase/erythrose-4-phosphate dehydrogenase
MNGHTDVVGIVDDAVEELEANLKQQDAIVEKFSWPELTDQQYIAAEHRLKECQEREQELLQLIEEVA